LKFPNAYEREILLVKRLMGDLLNTSNKEEGNQGACTSQIAFEML
jgi:hypothetical protein